MASISNDPNGRKRLLFTDPGGARKSISLGKVGRKAAEAVRSRVESLLAARITGQPLDRETALWLADVGDVLHAKLVLAGLASERGSAAAVTVAGLIAGYLESRRDIKGGTRVNLELAGRNLSEFLGGDRPIAKVTEADAAAFQQGLAAQGLATNTVRRRTGRARQFFKWAVSSRWLEKNPFDGLQVRTRGNPARKRYVPAEDVLLVVAQATSAEWRLALALCRFAGLRCPSEHLSLRWEDVDLEAGRMTIRSPKMERVEGKAERVAPVFPRLEPFFRAALVERRPGEEFVFNRLRRGGGTAREVNWSTRVLAFIRRAGLKPWPRLFNALRSSCETDLCEQFPAHVVCSWLGNSPAVANEHYLVVTDDHFRRALETGARDDAAQNTARPAAHSGDQERQNGTGFLPGGAEIQPGTANQVVFEEESMTPRGLEKDAVPNFNSTLSTDGGAICGAFFQFLENLAADPSLLGQVPPRLRGRVLEFLKLASGGKQ